VCAGAALDPPLWIVLNYRDLKALSGSRWLSLSSNDANPQTANLTLVVEIYISMKIYFPIFKERPANHYWPTPHTTPFFLPPEDPSPVLLHPHSIPE
jgi:hypothetical protein